MVSDLDSGFRKLRTMEDYVFISDDITAKRSKRGYPCEFVDVGMPVVKSQGRRFD